MLHKAGLIGYGNMGSWHAENVTERINDLTITAIYDISEDRRELAREKGFAVYDDVEDFFKADFDVVIVATPNNFHKHYSVMALNRGKNVVCEKPVCLSMDELEEILETAKRTGKVFTVHQNRRFDFDYVLMKKIYDSKILGNPFYLNSRLYSNRGISGGWRSFKEAGGGCLWDWGVHLIDQIVAMVDSKPVSVYAQLQNVRFKTVDDIARVYVQFENGLRAEIVADLWCYIKEARWHFSADDGTAIIDEWWGKEGKIIKANTKEVNWLEGCVYTPNGLSRTMWPRTEQEIKEIEFPSLDQEPRWEEFYENFLAAVEGKEEQLVTHEQIKTTLKILLAAFKSAEEEKVVTIKQGDKK